MADRDISVRELRNDVSAVLRRVEAGERLRVTVSGRPVAEIVPLPRRREFVPGPEIQAWLDAGGGADSGLLDDVRRGMDTTDDL